MANDIQPAKSLQERVGERIREQIGDLLTDDDLKRLVESAMQQAFFTRRIKTDSYGRNYEDKPPLIVETVKELMQPAIEKAAAEWVAQHGEELAQHIDDAIGRGAIRFLTNWLDNRLGQDFYQFGERVKKALNLDRPI